MIARQPRMTADEARSFDRFSVANFSQVRSQLRCSCNPYEDVFTFGRWRAQGYHVRKGEHGIRFTTMVEHETEKNENTGETRVISRPWTAYVFCRCQVEEDSNGTRR